MGGCRTLKCAMLAAAGAGALAVLSAVPARAVTCARPGGGGGCAASIQAAVDAAVAGETVYVFPGAYREGVRIPVDKPGLKLVGRGLTPAAVRIEASGLNLDGIQVEADNVLVRNLTVRGSATGVFSSRRGTTVSRVQVLGASGGCVLLIGDGPAVLETSVRSCGGPGIQVAGVDALVRGSAATLSGGVFVSGDRARVLGARVVSATGTGIQATGTSPLVRGSRVRGANGPAIQVNGTGVPGAPLQVLENRVSGGSGGVSVNAVGPAVVAGNVVQMGSGHGVSFTCSAACEGDRVSNNVVVARLSGGEGFRIDAAAPGGVLVAGNRATECAGDGFFISGPAFEIRENTAVGNGTFGGPGFRVLGDGNVLRRNVARGNGQAGFRIEGATATLGANRAEGNFGHGFVVGDGAPAAGAVLTGNRAAGNVDYGFFLGSDASDATVQNNTASGNAFSPFCDPGGAATVFAGNSFGGSSCMP